MPKQNGNEAWKLAQTGEYELMIWDAKLPGINGWDLLGKVRLDPELDDLPVFVITDKQEGDGAIPNAKHGFDMLLIRPNLHGIEMFVERCLKSVLNGG